MNLSPLEISEADDLKPEQRISADARKLSESNRANGTSTTHSLELNRLILSGCVQ